MIKIKSPTGGRAIAVQVSRRLTASDYYELIPLLIKMPHQPKKTFYFEIKFIGEWEYRTLYRHADAFDKVAIVGRKELKMALKEVMETFTSAKGRYFNTSQQEEAYIWING